MEYIDVCGGGHIFIINEPKPVYYDINIYYSRTDNRQVLIPCVQIWSPLCWSR